MHSGAPSCSSIRPFTQMIRRALPARLWGGPRGLATHAASQPPLSSPQTFIEKVVQKYAVDVPTGKAIRAGDYVMLRPERTFALPFPTSSC